MLHTKSIIVLVVFIVIGSLFLGCRAKPKTDSESIQSSTYTAGDKKSDTVVIYAQGGPEYALDKDFTNSLVKTFNQSKFLAVNVHQKQTKAPELFEKKEITFEEAQKHDEESVDMLAKVIKDYKKKGKKVYVLGVSFGSFVTQELISKYGVDIADKYLLMVGRVDMPETIWKGFSKGFVGYFEDGTFPIINPKGTMKDPKSQNNPTVKDKNMCKLVGGLSMNRYTKDLAKYDLTNVTYVYGKKDEQFGTLLDEEINFLKSKKATILASEGGHEDTIDKFLSEGFKTAFGIE